MKYMNDYDLHVARRRFTRATCPNRLALVMMVDNLRVHTDAVSDGWAYWAKPCRAAEKAISLIESTTNAANDAQEREDITDADMKAAARPVKAFLTRHRDVYREWQREEILRSIES